MYLIFIAVNRSIFVAMVMKFVSYYAQTDKECLFTLLALRNNRNIDQNLCGC